MDANRVEPGATGGIDVRLEPVPDVDCNVLDSRDETVERLDLPIQEAVIVDVENFDFENLLEEFEIEDHAGYRMRFACDGNLDHVVMAMA
jgi:hypothetical protein